MQREPNRFAIPHDMLMQLQAAAREECRAPEDLIGEAVERYLWERQFVARDTAHEKIGQALDSLRQGKGLDGEAVMAELMAGLDAPDPRKIK